MAPGMLSKLRGEMVEQSRKPTELLAHLFEQHQSVLRGLLPEMPVPVVSREDALDQTGNLPGGAGDPAEELALLQVCCLLSAVRPV